MSDNRSPDGFVLFTVVAAVPADLVPPAVAAGQGQRELDEILGGPPGGRPFVDWCGIRLEIRSATVTGRENGDGVSG